MLWMLLQGMVFPRWHNNTGTKNHNHSSDVRQLKLPTHSKVPFREKKNKIWKLVLLHPNRFLSSSRWRNYFIFYKLFSGWHTEPVLDRPQSQKHSWKSVVLCMVTEQTKSHMSPRINAPGNSKRQATTNVFSITNTFSCTGTNTWVWWLVSAFQV